MDPKILKTDAYYLVRMEHTIPRLVRYSVCSVSMSSTTIA